MLRLLIHKEGENPTIESPDLPQAECERQRQLVQDVISIRHREGGIEQARDAVVDLDWCSIGAHVITGVEIIDGTVTEEAV